MTLIVHHMQVSQSDKVVWLCEELGIEYELKIHHRDPIFSPQSIKDLSPMGQAPVIQDGPLTLSESAACVDYINYKHGNGRLALPPSHPNYADYLYWFHFASGNLQPRILQLLSHKWTEVPESHNWYKRSVEHMDKILTLFDQRVKDNEYLAGADFTAADCMSVFSLTTMRAFYPLDLSNYTNILAYLKRVTDRDGYKRYKAKADPDLELMINGPPPEQYVDQLKRQGKL